MVFKKGTDNKDPKHAECLPVSSGGGVKDEIEQQNKKAIHADGHPVGSVGGGGRGICKM